MDTMLNKVFEFMINKIINNIKEAEKRNAGNWNILLQLILLL